MLPPSHWQGRMSHQQSRRHFVDLHFEGYIPYRGKFAYGAKFRIFHIKLQDAKIETTKNFFMQNFENVKFFSSTRSTEQFEVESKTDGLALNP